MLLEALLLLLGRRERVVDALALVEVEPEGLGGTRRCRARLDDELAEGADEEEREDTTPSIGRIPSAPPFPRWDQDEVTDRGKDA